MNGYKKQRMQFLGMKTTFLRDISKLRKKWGIPDEGFAVFDDFKTWEIKLLESGENDNFNIDFENILEKNKLSRSYKGIYEFITLNHLEFFLSKSQSNLGFFWESDKKHKGKERLFIEVYADTTIEDIKSVWSFVNKIQKNSIGYRNNKHKKKNIFFERDKNIYELSRQGKSHKEIREIIKDRPGCKAIYVDDISKILASFRRKIAES